MGVFRSRVVMVIMLLALGLMLVNWSGSPGHAGEVDEEKLTAELWQISLEITRAEAESRRLAREAQSLAAERQHLAQRAAATAREAEMLRREAGGMLQYVYRGGGFSYLEVLLGAADLMDFFHRLDLVGYIMDYYLGRLDILVQARAEEAALAAELAEKDRLIRQQQATAERLLADLRQLQAERERVLAEARRLKAEGLLALERAWRQVLPVLDEFLQKLADVPVEEIEPVAVEVDLRRLQIRVTVRDVDLNRVLPPMGVRVSFTTGGLTLTGKGLPPEQPPFIMEMQVGVVRDGLQLFPLTLTVENRPVPGRLLSELVPATGLVLKTPSPVPGLELKDVELREGEARLTMVSTRGLLPLLGF